MSTVSITRGQPIRLARLARAAFAAAILSGLAACASSQAAVGPDAATIRGNAVPVAVDETYRTYLVRRDVKIWDGPSMTAAQVGGLRAGEVVQARLRPGPSVPWTYIDAPGVAAGFMVGNPMIEEPQS